jgi:enamine deaminase RidA (YjgF/YER057c/UK114 family)
MAAAKGLFERHQRERPDDLHRRHRRLGREGKLSGSPASRQFAQALRNTLAILAEDGAGPEHIVRMTCYVIDRSEYLRERDEIGAAWREIMGRITRRWHWSR